MTDDQAKAEVARLLLERAEMKRLGTDLSPDKLMLLKRLMYRLGMNNVKLQRRKALLRLARRIGVKRYGRVTPETLKKLAEGLSKNPENEDIRHAYADEHELAGNPGVAELIRNGAFYRDHAVSSNGRLVSNVDHVPSMWMYSHARRGDDGTKFYRIYTGHVGGVNPYYPDRPNIDGSYGFHGIYDEEGAHRIASTSPSIEGSQRIIEELERSHPWLRNRKYARGNRPIKYAKLDGHVVAHSLVQGFPIENALRHLANDPNNHPSIRELAKVAVTGGKDGDGSNIPMALWALHDELHAHKHPAKDWYNWMSAADKIGLDAHTYRALKEHAINNLDRGVEMGRDSNPESWHNQPEGVAVRIYRVLHIIPTASRSGPTAEEHAAIVRRVREMQPSATEQDVTDSIHRHAYRGHKIWRQREMAITPDDEAEFAKYDINQPRNFGDPKGSMAAMERATRYRRILRRLARRSGVEPSNTEGLRRYQMVAGDFLGALRRIRSSDQHAIRRTTEEIAAKLGLKPASTVDALHNSPAYSVPGVAQAIYANASPESVHAAAAWYGLTGNIPGMAVFHVRPDGPDMLHRFRMQGSGHDMLAKLDKAGIADRVLVPHRKGFDLLIPDRGGKMRDRVREFTQRQKTELQSSRGHFKLIGAADQAKAREMFRNTITKQEQRPTLRSRLRGMLVRMARSTPETIRRLMDAFNADQNNSDLRAALADELSENGREQEAKALRNPKRKSFVFRDGNLIPRTPRDLSHIDHYQGEDGQGRSFGFDRRRNNFITWGWHPENGLYVHSVEPDEGSGWYEAQGRRGSVDATRRDAEVLARRENKRESSRLVSLVRQSERKRKAV